MELIVLVAFSSREVISGRKWHSNRGCRLKTPALYLQSQMLLIFHSRSLLSMVAREPCFLLSPIYQSHSELFPSVRDILTSSRACLFPPLDNTVLIFFGKPHFYFQSCGLVALISFLAQGLSPDWLKPIRMPDSWSK